MNLVKRVSNLGTSIPIILPAFGSMGDGANAKPNDYLYYCILHTSFSPRATSVVTTDPLAANTSYKSNSLKLDGISVPNTGSGQVVQATVDGISSNTSRTLCYIVRVNAVVLPPTPT